SACPVGTSSPSRRWRARGGSRRSASGRPRRRPPRSPRAPDSRKTREAAMTDVVEFTDDQIHHLLRNADRLGFRIRPDGFVLINRARLIEDKGISKTNARLMDKWVTGVGGGVQALQRLTPEQARKHYQPTRRRTETMVWGIPADALKAAAQKMH